MACITPGTEICKRSRFCVLSQSVTPCIQYKHDIHIVDNCTSRPDTHTYAGTCILIGNTLCIHMTQYIHITHYTLHYMFLFLRIHMTDRVHLKYTYTQNRRTYGDIIYTHAHHRQTQASIMSRHVFYVLTLLDMLIMDKDGFEQDMKHVVFTFHY